MDYKPTPETQGTIDKMDALITTLTDGLKGVTTGRYDRGKARAGYDSCQEAIKAAELAIQAADRAAADHDGIVAFVVRLGEYQAQLATLRSGFEKML